MYKNLKFLFLIAMASSLSACANFSLFKDSNATPSPTMAPEAIPAPMAIEPTSLNAARINSLLTGKSWSWAGPKNNGVTLYASDGTSLVQVTGKGTTGGKWQARDGQLCESFNPAPFLPQGVPMTCQPFTGTAGSYKVGQATFRLAS